MRVYFKYALGILVCACGLGAFSSVFALPTDVTITPPNGARFLAGQKFDLRVEGKGTGPYSANIYIDGKLLPFTSGAQNTTTTDGITSAGWGGFNLRGYSNTRAGLHTIRATFTDASGTVVINSVFEIVDLRNFVSRSRTLSVSDTKRELLESRVTGTSTSREQAEALLTPERTIQPPVKNIILMIGDGMGIAHRTAARIVKYGVTAGRPNGYLAMDNFPGTGFLSTHSLNSIITDSAPGMSCYTTGNHQNNNQEGVFPAHVTNPFFAPRIEYLSEYLHRIYGKVLGLVSTADVEDATPAANAVHTLARGNGTGIVDQYLDESDPTNSSKYGTGLSVLMGGGRRWFLPTGQFGSSRSANNDYPALPDDLVKGWNLAVPGALDANRNLIQDFKNAGFAYADSLTSLNSVANTSPDKLLGLFAYGNMNVALDKLAKRRNTPLDGQSSFVVDDYHAPDQPMLEEMTESALRVLNRNPYGFVLMVEGAHIDKQSHAMDADRAILDAIEFDNAVAAARNFADVNGDTLVIVTADHECSGFSLIGALTGTIQKLQSLPSDNQTLDPNTQPERQKLVGVYDAAGFPQYKLLSDGYPQTLDINGKLLVGFGANGDRFESWLQKPLPIVDSLLSSDIQGELRTKGYSNDPIDRSEKQTGFYIRGQAIGKSQAVHTASDVPISVYSSGSNAWLLFTGVQENTDVFFKIMRAVTGKY